MNPVEKIDFKKSPDSSTKIPSGASLRRILATVLRTDSEFNAFCLDYFPMIHREFAAGMTRTDKTNLLMVSTEHEELLSCINKFDNLKVKPSRYFTKPNLDSENSFYDKKMHYNRIQTIKKVRKFWIDGVLQRSLHDCIFVNLDKEFAPRAIIDPWDKIVEGVNTGPELIPASATILDLFDDAAGQLLILGSPGAGKTTTLLSLCSSLLDRAEGDATFPIPVIFKLTTWGRRRIPISEWIIEEMILRYNIPKKISTAWVESGHVLPLMDGLDEIVAEYRDAAIRAINAFIQENGYPSMVICSRTLDYEQLTTRSILQQAIVIKPLSLQQVDNCLHHAGQAGKEARNLVNSRPAIHELVSSPFFLSILLLVCSQAKELTKISKPDQAPTDIVKRLIKSYCCIALSRRPYVRMYPPNKFLKFLMEIGRSLQEQGKSIYFTEELQSRNAWKGWQRFLFKYTARFLLWSTYFFVLLVALAIKQWNLEQLMDLPMVVFVASITWSFISGIFDRRIHVEPLRKIAFSWENLFTEMANARRNLAKNSTVNLGGIKYPLNSWFLSHFVIGNIIVLNNMGKLLLLLGVDSIFHGMFMLFAGGIQAYLTYLLLKYQYTILVSGLKGLFFPTVLAVRLDRNGTKFSLRVSALILSLLIGSICLYTGEDAAFKFTIVGLLFFGPIFWSFGGLHTARHYTLRIIFYLNGMLPLNLEKFLDCCDQHMLLRKVGTGYIFVHDIVQSYISGLNKEDIDDLAKEVSA